MLSLGYDTSYQYPFSVVGRNGRLLNEQFLPHPKTYLSVCTDGFPNWFMSLVPNSAVGTGSQLIIMEREIDYAVEVAKKIQREHLKSIEVKAEAVNDYDEYVKVRVYLYSCFVHSLIILYSIISIR